MKSTILKSYSSKTQSQKPNEGRSHQIGKISNRKNSKTKRIRKSQNSTNESSIFLQTLSMHWAALDLMQRTVEKSIIKLEFQIAQCQRKFNSIGWTVSQKCKSLNQIEQRNIELSQINSKLNQQVQILSAQNEELKRKQTIDGLQKKIVKVKRQIQFQNIDSRTSSLKSVGEILQKYMQVLEKQLPKNESDIYTQTIREIVGVLCQNQPKITEYLNFKIKELIEVKVRLAKMEFRQQE